MGIWAIDKRILISYHFGGLLAAFAAAVVPYYLIIATQPALAADLGNLSRSTPDPTQNAKTKHVSKRRRISCLCRLKKLKSLVLPTLIP